MTARRRLRLFWAVAGICIATIALALGLAIRAGGAASEEGRRATAAASPRLADLVSDGHAPVLVFRSLDRDRPQEYGRLAFARIGASASVRTVSGLRCDRVAFSGDRGLCVSQTTGIGSRTRITVLDAALRALRTLTVAGVPSRARVSPDGRRGTVTTFVTGHYYAQPGEFSTQALILDLPQRRLLLSVQLVPLRGR